MQNLKRQNLYRRKTNLGRTPTFFFSKVSPEQTVKAPVRAARDNSQVT